MANYHEHLLEPILIHEIVTQSTWSTGTCDYFLYFTCLFYLRAESIAMPQQRPITPLPVTGDQSFYS